MAPYKRPPYRVRHAGPQARPSFLRILLKNLIPRSSSYPSTFRRLNPSLSPSNPLPRKYIMFPNGCEFSLHKGELILKKMFRNIFQSQDTFAQQRRENTQKFNIIIHSRSLYNHQPTLLLCRGWASTSPPLVFSVFNIDFQAPVRSSTFPVGRSFATLCVFFA